MNSTVTEPRPAPSSPDPGNPITATGLGHRYGRRRALKNVSFAVAPGEVFGFLGPNGGGKSTLFRILSTMIPPSEGSLHLFGRDPVRDLTAARRDLGVVFQSPSLDPLLTARENLVHHGHLHGLHGKRLRTGIEELLERTGLTERARDRVSSFSGGMRRRLEIGKALLSGPRLLILDEPSTGLDPGARADMWDHLRGLRAERGVTIAFTTHLMEEAEGCDRLGILDAGNLVALDTPESLKSMVGGDVITVEADDAAGLAPVIAGRFGMAASVVRDRIRLERRSGHEFVAALVEAFPGKVRSVMVGRPTLEDVFFKLTGHDLSEGAGGTER